MISYQIPHLQDQGTVVSTTLTSFKNLATTEAGIPTKFRTASTANAGRVETADETFEEGN